MSSVAELNGELLARSMPGNVDRVWSALEVGGEVVGIGGSASSQIGAQYGLLKPGQRIDQRLKIGSKTLVGSVGMGGNWGPIVVSSRGGRWGRDPV